VDRAGVDARLPAGFAGRVVLRARGNRRRGVRAERAANRGCRRTRCAGNGCVATVVERGMGDVVARMRAWVSVRHSLPVEAALVVALYALYETARGIVVGDTLVAERHADRVAALERWLHVFGEGSVQRTAHAVPGLPGLLGAAYLSLHLTVTI